MPAYFNKGYMKEAATQQYQEMLFQQEKGSPGGAVARWVLRERVDILSLILVCKSSKDGPGRGGGRVESKTTGKQNELLGRRRRRRRRSKNRKK